MIRKYSQRDNKTNYCLTNASEPTLLHQPPALAIPDTPAEPDEPMQPDEPDMEEPRPVSEPVVMQIPPTRDAIQDLRMAKAFARVCGKPATALEILDKLPDMPMQTLKEFLTVLTED